MKPIVPALTICLVAASMCFSQDQTKDGKKASPSEKKTTPTGFDWIKQFEGNWGIQSKAPSAKGPAQHSTMTSRVIGKFWVINEFNSIVGGTKFHAVQTIGYDKKKKNYTVTWVDSMMDYKWTYTGSVNADGTTISMEADGPDWEDSTKTRRYRDVYEFKSATEIATLSQMQNKEGKWETFNQGTMTKMTAATADATSKSKTTVTPFLMFQGKALQAIDFYKAVFPGTKVESIKKYKAGEAGKEGTVSLATILIANQRVKCLDSPAIHDFDFTPSFSFFVECENEEQIKERFTKLSEGGKVMMPLDNYGFSKNFGWVSDKFGISWQLNLQ